MRLQQAVDLLLCRHLHALLDTPLEAPGLRRMKMETRTVEGPKGTQVIAYIFLASACSACSNTVIHESCTCSHELPQKTALHAICSAIQDMTRLVLEPWVCALLRRHQRRARQSWLACLLHGFCVAGAARSRRLCILTDLVCCA